MKNLIFLTLSFVLISGTTNAQDQRIKDYLDAYIGENATPYLQPLSDLLSSNINTGIWEWSNFDSKFYFRLKVQAMFSFPSESMRTFNGKTTGDFRPSQTVLAPTIIGERKDILIQGEDNTFFIFPGGYNLRQLILGTPQITVGGFLNSEISGRFLSFSLGKDIGRVRCIGIGARHSLTGYFDESPFDLSVGYFYHHIEASTYLDSDQNLFSVHLGKTGKLVSGQLMIGYQTSSSRLHYTYEDGEDIYNVDLALQNNYPWIFEASAGLRLGPVFASGAISYSKFVTVSAGAGLFF